MEVLAGLPDPPSYSAVRALLATLEAKGFVRHRKEGARHYIYAPTQPRDDAAQAALKRVLQTFFNGSVKQTVSALLHIEDADLDPEEIAQFSALIEQAREEGR